MKIKQFSEILVSSFFSKRLYQEVCFKWQGYAIFYLIVLLLIANLPSLFGNLYYINSIDIDKIKSEEYQASDDINGIIKAIIKQLPTIKINNGIATSSSTDPVSIYAPNGNQLIAIIDTAGKVKDSESREALILLTANNLIIQVMGNNGQPNVTEYSLNNFFKNSEEIIVDHNEIINILAKVKQASIWLLPLVYLPATIFFSLIYAVLKLACYAVIGWGYIKYLLRKNAYFNQIFRLAVISSTPPMIIATLLSIIPIYSSLFAKFGYYFVLFSSLMYFTFAIKSCLEPRD